jgi:hypothetical protein
VPGCSSTSSRLSSESESAEDATVSVSTADDGAELGRNQGVEIEDVGDSAS